MRATRGVVPPSRPACSHHTGRCTCQSCHWKGETRKFTFVNALVLKKRVLQAFPLRLSALLSCGVTLNNTPHSGWGLMLGRGWWAGNLGGATLQFF